MEETDARTVSSLTLVLLHPVQAEWKRPIYAAEATVNPSFQGGQVRPGGWLWRAAAVGAVCAVARVR